jgi:hypothetical protein
MGAWSWAFWIGGALLGLLGLWLLYWSLLHDRARGRRRCPKCWYDMAGVPGITCPECGRTVKRERRFYRTRRRWRWVGAALLLFVASAGALYSPTVARLGWLGASPTWALAVAARWYDTPQQTLFWELDRRAQKSTNDKPGWLSRVAFAWYGGYRLRSPLPMSANALAPGTSFYVLLNEVEANYGFNCIKAGGPQSWSQAAAVYERVKTGDGRFSMHFTLTGAVSYTGTQCLAYIAMFDQDRHGLLSHHIFDEKISEVRAVTYRMISSPVLDPRVAVAITRRGVTGADAYLRRELIDILLERKDLLSVLNDVDEIARLCDARGYDSPIRQKVAVPSAFPRVCENAADPDSSRRREALQRLASWGAGAAPCRQTLWRVLESDPDEDCRWYAVLTLGWMCQASTDDAGALRRAIREDVSERVRAAAIEAYLSCPLLPDRDMVCVYGLVDSSATVKLATLRCMARVGDDLPTARSHLETLVNNADPDVRHEAVEAIAALQRRDKDSQRSRLAK